MKSKNKLYPVTLVSIFLTLFLILVPFTVSAAQVQKVEIRGPVYSGSNIDDIIDTYGDGTALTIDATQFAAFYYDHNNSLATESLIIRDTFGTEGNTIAEGGIVYRTTIQTTNYKFEDWGVYPIIGFFGEQYIPINPSKAYKLAKLVLDSDDKYNIRTGGQLDLDQGYALEVKQIDVDGGKVWLELDKDGEHVDDEIISVTNGSDNTWEVELDNIEDEYDVVVFKVHVSQVFQDSVSNVAQIEGLWLIDYANAMTIESDDEFGELNDVSIYSDTIIIVNADTFSLIKDDTVELAEGLAFKVADTSSNMLRFYVVKEITEPGTYEVRGQVASGTGNFTWNATNFAGFYYDFDGGVATESLNVSDINGNVIPVCGLKYTTIIENIDYRYHDTDIGWDTYPFIGFFGEKYVPINPDKANKLAKLILDGDDAYSIRTGEQLDLGQGYALKVKQIDVDGGKVWLELDKDGEHVDDENISVLNNGTNTWEVELDDIKGEYDVVVFKVHVNQVFQGEVDSIVQIKGLWLIDYANATTIESDDEFSTLNNVSILGDILTISNKNIFTLIRGSEIEIGQDMYFKIANTSSAELRYYPFIENTIEDNNSKVFPDASFTASPSSGDYPLTVLFTDTSQNSTSRSWDVNGDGGVDSTDASFSYTYNSRGDYPATLTARNANGTDTASTTISVTRKSSGSSHSSGGGGGGGGSPEPAKNVEVKELAQVFITNGKAVQFDFTKNATCVVYVGFDAKKTVGKTTTIVEQLKNKSTLVSNLTDGEVYKYFNVWVGNSGFASSENIENSTICFKVEKSWMQDKNIDRDSITLNRYSNKTWEQIPVSLLKEDNKYLYFTADVSGFSFFAITGKEIAKETMTDIQSEPQLQDPEEKIGNTTGNTAGVKQEPEQEQNKSTPGFVMIYGVASLLVFYFYKRK